MGRGDTSGVGEVADAGVDTDYIADHTTIPAKARSARLVRGLVDFKLP